MAKWQLLSHVVSVAEGRTYHYAASLQLWAALGFQNVWAGIRSGRKHERGLPGLLGMMFQFWGYLLAHVDASFAAQQKNRNTI